MVERSELESRFAETDARLTALTNQDPAAAVQAARDLLPDEILTRDNVDALAAGTLIDAGAAARDPGAVDDGIAILEHLLGKAPHRADLEYCLANGLSAQADFSRATGPGWYVATRDVRRRARYLYQSAGSKQSTPHETAARAFANLGNSLLAAYRLVEAYDAYLKAVELDSTNGVALSGAARALLLLAQYGIGEREVLLAVAAKHLAAARQDPERMRELAGEQGYQQIVRLLETDIASEELLDFSGASEYQQFVVRHRLTLAPTVEGLDLTSRRWDSLRLGGIIEPVSAGPGTPPLFTMFNVLKSDFLAARYLAFAALQDEIPESGSYTDSLDYATYGVQAASMTLAQRACVDVLDKIAVAASEYLDLPGSPTRVSFMNRWFEPRRHHRQVRLQQAIEVEIAAGNRGLVAMTEVAGDIEAGGFLADKRSLRHSSTHRFTVLHDLGGAPERQSKYVDHFATEAFVDQLLETLRLTRAVVLYFVDMVMIREHRRHHAGDVLPTMTLPDHDWVRGVDA